MKEREKDKIDRGFRPFHANGEPINSSTDENESSGANVYKFDKELKHQILPIEPDDFQSEVGEVRMDRRIIKAQLSDGSIVRIYSVEGKPPNHTGKVRDQEDFDRIRKHIRDKKIQK